MTYIPAFFDKSAGIVRRPDRCRIVETDIDRVIELALAMQAKEGRLVQITESRTGDAIYPRKGRDEQ